MKTHFTRKNFISLGLVFFYILFAFIAGLLIDANNPFGLKEKANIVRNISLAFGFPSFVGSVGAWVLISLILINVLLFAAAFIFEKRVAKLYEEKATSLKWIGIYLATFVILFGLAFGIGIIAQYPYEGDSIKNSVLFMIETLFMGFLIFLFAFILIGATCMLVINLKNIDKPFRFFGKKVQEEEEKEALEEENEAKQLEEMGNLAASFGENNSNNLAAGNGTLLGASGNVGSVGQENILSDKEKVFPGLCTIDVIEQARKEELFEDKIDLSTLCVKFREYLAKSESLYFSLDTIRAFISGLAASKLIILEGLSGTGKSSLARYFSEFIGEESFFAPVQATWRDRTSLLGYYNDFSKSYNETEFLKRLYQANYRLNHINVMVLDELNISRVEYYFADFLSILEYPKDKWKLKIMELPYEFETPEKLEDGVLNIPESTWFIGTANKDDSTYTITDKVYDRAITISFDDRNEAFDVKGNGEKVSISYEHLLNLYSEALGKKENLLSSLDKERFKKITDFTNDTFDVTFGNRINTQIEILVPVYVSCGGTKEEALDFMLSRKLISKLNGRYEDYIKQGLIDLKELISKVYGKDTFRLTNHEIDKLLRKL